MIPRQFPQLARVVTHGPNPVARDGCHTGPSPRLAWNHGCFYGQKTSRAEGTRAQAVLRECAAQVLHVGVAEAARRAVNSALPKVLPAID